MRDRGGGHACHGSDLCDRRAGRAGRRADRARRRAPTCDRGGDRGDPSLASPYLPLARSRRRSRRSARRSRLSERRSRASLPMSRRSLRRSRRSERMSRVSPRTSPDRSGATACAPAIVERPGRERHGHAKCNQCVAKHCEILQRSVGARREHRAVRGGRRMPGRRVKGSTLPSVSQKRWYRSAPGWTDAIPAAEVRCRSTAYDQFEGALTALPTPGSPTPSVPPAAPVAPAAPVGPPAPLEFPLSWLLEFAPPPIQYRAAIEVARLPITTSRSFSALPYAYQAGH